MADLLLELFSEEVPARMQEEALEHLRSTFVIKCNKEKLLPDSGWSPKGFITPRHLAIWATDLPIAQADISTELKGPKIDAPDAAIQGFLKKNNLTQDQLEKRDGVYFANIHQKGRSTANVLKDIIEDIFKTFPWPKSMRWGSNDISWVRPLHSILCLFDGKIVPVEFGPVKAGNMTQGHRFLSPQAITITDANDYEEKLKHAYVYADRNKRKALILAQAEKTAADKGLVLKKDDGLLEEVTGLVEWPVVLPGKIDAQFMDLPKEVLISEMRAHQKYFALENKDGSLSDTFLITSNMETKDGGKAVIAGNERVLRARLSDGRFFWDQDRKKKLDDWAKGLASVTFHAKLGSIADKVNHIKSLAMSLCDYIKADKELVERAADLCKADLVTGMVGEFPELQGVMGRYYAQHQKEATAVADAIRDHYLPLGPSSPVPTEPVSICVALADKFDTLVSMFAIGEKPTGSKDPFALRRSALGIIRILLDNNLRIPLVQIVFRHALIVMESISKSVNEKFIEDALAKYRDLVIFGKINLADIIVKSNADESSKNYYAAKVTAEIFEFLIDRLKVQLKDQGIRHDVISAVVADGDDDLVHIVARAKTLQAFLGTKDGANLLTAYKRAANILAIEEKKDKTTYRAEEVLADLLKEPEEIALHKTLAPLMPEIKMLAEQEKFTESMSKFAQLRAPVDHFFDKIMVNCEDKELRANRLRLLADIKRSMDSIAHFALIEG